MTNCFAGHGLFINGVVFLSQQEVLPFLLNGALLVDLRDGLEHNGCDFSVPNVLFLPYKDFKTHFATLPTDIPLILADCVGLLAKQGAIFLQKQGFDRVAVLNGGMVGWYGDGMPTIVDGDGQLTGGCACRNIRSAPQSRSGANGSRIAPITTAHDVMERA